MLQHIVDLWRRAEAPPNGEMPPWKKERFIRDVIIPRLNTVFHEKYPEIESWHDVRGADDEESYVVHYTGLNTLISILSSYEDDNKPFLRMYDSFHLNDPEEGSFLTSPSDLGIGEPTTKDAHAYVASFVIFDESDDKEFGDEDDLTCWLAYGRGGRGCSIKIPVRNDRFRRVLYGQSDSERTLARLDIPSILQCIQPLTENYPEGQTLLHQAIWAALERIRYLYKGEAYRYERECRLVKSAIDLDLATEVKFEPEQLPDSSYRVRHYYEDEDLRIDKILITGSCITLGPLVPHPDNISLYIRSLLDKAGLMGPEIKISKIPYQDS